MQLTRRELLIRGTQMGALSLLGVSGFEPGSAAFAQARKQPGKALLLVMDKYSLLRGEITDFKGAGSTSASLMARALKAHNFPDIEVLVNPTSTQVESAIMKHAPEGRPFCVYCLCHGGRSLRYEGTLLWADAEDEKDNTFLTRDELRQLVTTIIQQKGCPLTIVLDACESYAMAFSLSKALPRTNRAFPLAYNQFKDMRQAIRAKPAPDARTTALISPLFLTATDDKQKAWVSQLPTPSGTRYVGIYSFYLSRALHRATSQNRWQNIHDQTVMDCARYAKEAQDSGVELQTPQITPAYLPLEIFAFRMPDTLDLHRLFELNFPATSLLSIQVRPEKHDADPISLAVGERFDIGVKVGQPGFLIALEKTPRGEYALHFPADGRLESARVEAGVVELPTNRERIYYHDSAGPDVFKAFLYQDAQSASRFLSMLRPLIGNPMGEIGAIRESNRSRPFLRGDVLAPELVTASFTFDVRPSWGGAL